MKNVIRGLVLTGILKAVTGSLLADEPPPSLYVINSLAQTLSKITLDNAEVADNIVAVGEIPNRIHAKDSHIYIVNSTPPGVIVVDALADTLVRSIALPEGSNPWDMVFVAGDTAYITALLADAVYVYDLASGDSVDTIPVGIAPEGILRVGDEVYVTNSGGWFNNYLPSSISRIDVRSRRVTGNLEVPRNPQDLAIAPDGKLHVICTGNYFDRFGQVVVVDIADGALTPIDTVVVGGSPGDIAITNAGVGYVSDFGSQTNGWLYAYDTSNLAIINDANDAILVGAGVTGIYYDAQSDGLYVPNMSDDTVQLLDAGDGAVLHTYDVGDGPLDVTIIGQRQPSGVTGQRVSRPASFRLGQNFPNPFNPKTTIEFTLLQPQFVAIRIFNLQGQLIRTLRNEFYQIGSHRVGWDGRDDDGGPVSSASYIYEMRVDGQKASRLLTLLK
jgi:hypothetical protein